MKKLASVVCIVCFISLAVFGFFAMTAGGSMVGCIAAAMGPRGACPLASPLEVGLFHVGAFKTLSTGVAAFLALLFAAFIFFGRAVLRDGRTFARAVVMRRHAARSIATAPLRADIARRILSPCA